MTIAEQLRTIKHALGVQELAELLQLNERTIRNYVKAGRIPYLRIGMTIRFDPDQLADWLEGQSPISIKSVKLERYAKRNRVG
jgi:excisionase family DNA binding protein